MLLNIGQHHAQHQHATDDDRGAHIAHRQRYHADHQQLDDQRIAAALGELHQQSQLLLGSKIIAPVNFARSLRRILRQPGFSHPELLERLVRRKRGNIHQPPLMLGNRARHRLGGFEEHGGMNFFQNRTEHRQTVINRTSGCSAKSFLQKR